jgi:SecD/SecF fusion protein
MRFNICIFVICSLCLITLLLSCCSAFKYKESGEDIDTEAVEGFYSEVVSSFEENVSTAQEETILLFIEGDEETSEIIYEKYIKGEEVQGVILTQDNVVFAIAKEITDEAGNKQHIIDLGFDEVGKKLFEESTTHLYQYGGEISIWYNGECISSPTVQAPLTDGRVMISGNLTEESAKELAEKLDGKK